MKKKGHLTEVRDCASILRDNEYGEILVEFLENSVHLEQWYDPNEPADLVIMSNSQAKELFRQLSQKFLVSG